MSEVSILLPQWWHCKRVASTANCQVQAAHLLRLLELRSLRQGSKVVPGGLDIGADGPDGTGEGKGRAQGLIFTTVMVG